MGKKARKIEITLKLKGQEERVEDFLRYKLVEYEKSLDENRTIFKIKGRFEQVNEVALFLYSQFKFDDFIALDGFGNAFLCW